MTIQERAYEIAGQWAEPGQDVHRLASQIIGIAHEATLAERERCVRVCKAVEDSCDMDTDPAFACREIIDAIQAQGGEG